MVIAHNATKSKFCISVHQSLETLPHNHESHITRIAIGTISTQGIFIRRNNGNCVRALFMSADYMVYLLLSFGGIQGFKTEKSRGSSDSSMSMGKAGKMGKAGSMMSMDKAGKGGSMMSMGKSGKGSLMTSMSKSGKSGPMMSTGKSGKGSPSRSNRSSGSNPTLIASMIPTRQLRQ
jgi:hypothetical protein